MKIDYCRACRTRVSSLDVDEGGGVVLGRDTYCRPCARDLGLDEPSSGRTDGYREPIARMPRPLRTRGMSLRSGTVVAFTAVLAAVLVIALMGIAACRKEPARSRPGATAAVPAAKETAVMTEPETDVPAVQPAAAETVPAAATAAAKTPKIVSLIDAVAADGPAWRHFSEGDRYEAGFSVSGGMLRKSGTQKNCRIDRSIEFTGGEIAFDFDMDGNYWEFVISALGQDGNSISLAFDRGALGRHRGRITVSGGTAVILIDGLPSAEGLTVSRTLNAPIDTGVNIRIFAIAGCALSFTAFTYGDSVPAEAAAVAVPGPRVPPVTAPAAAVRPVAAAPRAVRMLSGCNTAEEKDRISWSTKVKVKLVPEHATEGSAAAEVTFLADQQYAGFSMRDEILAGWGDYDSLRFDVFNPDDEDVDIYVRIDDDQSRDSDYTTYYGRRFKLFPGANEIRLKTSRLPNQVQPWLQRNLDPDKLKLFTVWLAKPATTDTVLYFDNFILTNPPQVNLPAGMQAFTFGPGDADRRPGFIHVTPQSAFTDETGYGFKDISGLKGLDDNYDREGLKNGETLCGSGICRGGPLTFMVNLVPGRYRLWGAAGMTIFPKREYTVTCNGQPVFRSEAGDRFRGLDPIGRDYSRRTTIWETLAAGQLYDEFNAEIAIGNSRAEITIAGDYASWLSGGLRALVLYPAGSTEAEQVLADMLAQRKAQFLAKWCERPPADRPSPPAFTAEEQARGFMLAYRHYEEEITPYFVPRAEDRLERLAIAVTPGEKEPAVFIVYPAADADRAEVAVSDLAGSAGTIPASAVRIEYVHYRYLKTASGIDVVPSHIVPLDHLPLEQGVPRQFWLTVTPPADAAPGKYAGTVTVTTAGGRGSFLLEVEVYPFKLDSVADCGLIYAHIWSVPDDRSDMEAAVRCLVEHNCNSATLSSVIRLDSNAYKNTGAIVLNLDKLDTAMDVMKAAGMTGPVPLFDMSIQGEGGGNSYSHIGLGKGSALDTPEYFDAITEVTRQIKAHAASRDYLPVLMYPVTELSNDPTMGPPYLERLVKAFRRVEGIQLICSLNTPKDIVCAGYLDHMMVNWGLDLTQERLAQIRNDGAKLWFQNIGKCRYNEGFLMLKAGAIGRRQFTVSCSIPGGTTAGGDPYNTFNGGGNGSMFRTADGAIPNISLRWMSEGADDYRYAALLRKLISEADAQNSAEAGAAAAAARQAYDAILAQIHIGTAGGAIERDGRCDRMGNYHDKSTYDRFRRTIAERIIALKTALGR